MKIAIIDADLIGRKKHRFPNLACMKISSYHKKNNDEVTLKTDYNNLNLFDKIYLSKVFTDTEIPNEPIEKSNKNHKTIIEWYANNTFLKHSNVSYGGTGFFYDKAPNLPDEIEHTMPDYHLYDKWISEKVAEGAKLSEFKEYTDYSIGFLTRGCFRKCEFCVNKKYNKVNKHSQLSEFYDASRKKVCLLDDNFFGCSDWNPLLLELKATNKPFKFKQGMDERILTKEKCELLFSCKYDSDPYFAFDNIDDYQLIEEKLKILRQTTDKQCIFYVLCGFDRKGKYDSDFWRKDIFDTFERIKLLMKYKCLPYIMRFEKYQESPYRGMYINLARWCNQFSFFKKKSFREFCISAGDEKSSCQKYMRNFEAKFPEIKEYYDMKF